MKRLDGLEHPRTRVSLIVTDDALGCSGHLEILRIPMLHHKVHLRRWREFTISYRLSYSMERFAWCYLPPPRATDIGRLA
jgi:hypothetical protein